MRKNLVLVICCACLIATVDVVCLQAGENDEYGREISGDELLTTLERIAQQLKANYASIETWKGKCRYRDAKYFVTPNPALPGNHGGADDWREAQLDDAAIAQALAIVPAGTGCWFFKEGDAEFLVDQRNQQYRVLKQISAENDVLDLSTKLRYRNTIAPFQQYSLLSSEKIIEFSPDKFFTRNQKGNPDDDAVFPRAHVVSVFAPPKSISFDLIDVRDWNTIGGPMPNDNNNKTYWMRPERTAAALRGTLTPKDLEVAQKYTKLFVSEADGPIYTLLNGDRAKSYSICRFDGRIGLNVTSFTQGRGERTHSLRTTTYQTIGDMFLPSDLRDKWISYDKEGQIVGVMCRSLEIHTEWINEPIAEREFEVTSLGLKYGDRRFDEISGEQSVYDDRAGFVPVAEFQMDAGRYDLAQNGPPKDVLQPVKQVESHLFLVINAVVVLCIVGYLIFRRPMKTT